jgi:ankyrin repeat protein
VHQHPDTFKCLELFRTSGYESHKERNPDRVVGTCQWVLQHERFQNWQRSEVPSLLWVSADPGCGKSVLSKSLVDTEFLSTESRTTCYFFFKDDNADQKSVTKALCALLHQLFSKNYSLIEHALSDFKQEGSSLPQLFYNLWRILIKATNDPRAGEIICVLDALDECEESGRYQLIDSFNKYFNNTTSCKRHQSTLKFLVTSRPYFDIERRFKQLTHNIPTIRLEGEKESESISREITSVIKVRAQQVGLEVGLDCEEASTLERKLLEAPQRTYLWLKLIFDEIRSSLSVTKLRLEKIITTLPDTVEKAYEAILAKSTNAQQARKLLCIVIAAVRPLTLREMNIALNVEDGCNSYGELDLEKEQNFETVVKNLCGLFVSVIDGKVYLIHQTAKEFLVAKNGAASSGWKYSIQPTEAELVLMIICVNYLKFSTFEDYPLVAHLEKEDEVAEGPDEERWSVEAVLVTNSQSLIHVDGVVSYLKQHEFLEYAATNWTAHCRRAGPTIGLPAMELLLPICNLHTKRYQTWFMVYWTFQNHWKECPEKFNVLMVASYFGLEAVLKYQLEKGENPNQTDDNGRTPLSWAAEELQETVVKLLLAQNEVDVNSRDWGGRTPLMNVVESMRFSFFLDRTSVNEKGVTKEAIVTLLLSRNDIRVNITDHCGRTLLLLAVERENVEVVKLLISRSDIDVNARDDRYRTPLSMAAKLGDEAILKLLVSRIDLEVDPQDHSGRTPLSMAAGKGHEGMVKLLLSRGAKTESTDTNGWSPLIWAAIHGHDSIIQLLVDRGAERKGQNLDQALLQAVDKDSELGIKWLLNCGARVAAVDGDGCTALHLASYMGHEKAIAQLLQHGASMAAQNAVGETPLHVALRWGKFGAAWILVSARSPLEICNVEGQTPLMYAESFVRGDDGGFTNWLRAQS